MTRGQMIQELQRIERAAIAARGRSAWDKGVAAYILDIIGNVVDGALDGWIDPEGLRTWDDLRLVLLNGADDWNGYSYGGLALVYDEDIAKRLCTPSELRRNDHGRRGPNRRETWPDVQARALRNAAADIRWAARETFK